MGYLVGPARRAGRSNTIPRRVRTARPTTNEDKLDLLALREIHAREGGRCLSRNDAKISQMDTKICSQVLQRQWFP
jgi:hypothetical protein